MSAGRLALSVCVVTAALLGAGCSGSGMGAASLHVATDTRTEIRAGHLLRPVLIDGGTLRLDPLPGTPRLSESRAITLFRAGATGPTLVSYVTVVYALTTLRLRVPNDPRPVVQYRTAPVFDHRPAWIVIWRDEDFHGCKEGPEPGSNAPAQQSVELIAANGSGEALAYTTGGSRCGRTVPPQVGVANYYVSLPWTVASRSGSRVVIRHPAPPACGSTQGSPFESDIESDAGRTNATFRVYADVAAVRPPCHSPDHDTVVENAPRNATLLHVKTGVSVGYDTSGTSLTYYDGTTHTI